MVADLSEREARRVLSENVDVPVLHIADATVRTHVGRILTKLDLRDRTQAVVFAYESGLVRPGDGP